ncbi:MAG: ferritin-like domain-containing protein [Methylococcaceae bacterium]|nr:ferritin-like domain-containing protein [Methylococcaceae bacterium]
MTSLFDCAEAVLLSDAIDRKVELTLQAADDWRNHRLDLNRSSDPLPIEALRLPPRPEQVEPRMLRKRKLASAEGRLALLHAVAHIEFSAIQLAWDHLYRFSGMPQAYYADWLGVAEDEARHFLMIRERLRSLGADYGDLPAHGGLWGLARETAADVLARMALLPRFMEARGLDVTPGIMQRLEAAGDAESVACLQLILDEEVGHVALGSRWFGWECQRRGLVPETAYVELVERHLRGQIRGPFNDDLRRRAGFSDDELARLRRMAQPER